jgi:hypothetical protein
VDKPGDVLRDSVEGVDARSDGVVWDKDGEDCVFTTDGGMIVVVG